MADKLMRAQVTIPRATGVPEDAITNTWHFDGDDVNETDAAYHSAVMSGLTTFYNSIDQFLSGMASPTATVKIYDMRDATPRVPEFTGTIALTLGTGLWMPAEVAICLSFQAAAASGVNQARRRGRIYLGPIDHDATYTQNLGDVRPTSTCRDAIAAAADTLHNGIALPVTGQVKWAVYSPTTDVTDTIDNAFNDVDNGWVDNAYDTQRRRGVAPTLRSLFS